MASSTNVIDWEQLKPRILQDLASGKTQQQVRKGLEEDPDDTLRVSISKSHLETKLNQWNYRSSLREQEWKVVSHRINKRRKARKPTSQVLVNGYVFSERQVAKAITRYDTPTLISRLPSPQIPPELSHHLIEVRTPPSSHWSLQPQQSNVTVAQTARDILALHQSSARSVWPQNAQWRGVELSVGQFVDRFFIPTYAQDEGFCEAFNTPGLEFLVSRTFRGKNTPVIYSGHKSLLPDQAWLPNPSFSNGGPIHRGEMLRSSGRPYIHTAIVETLVGLLYDLSNESLDSAGSKTLASIIEAPAWNTVLPHLREVLTVIDSNITHAVAEGLLKESIRICHHMMLELSLGLGADPAQRVFNTYISHEHRYVLVTPLVALCQQYRKTSQQEERHWGPSPEKLILFLLKSDLNVSKSSLLWIIGASCHAIAEEVIRSQPERAIDFAVKISDCEGASAADFYPYDPITPLLVACLDDRQSAEKLSLIRCLLERHAKAGLREMVAAAGSCDREVISLLHQQGAPVDGFIPDFHSPLTAACLAFSYLLHIGDRILTTIRHLLRLGASPNHSKNKESSPLHILVRARDRPVVTQALGLLLEYGADINHRTSPKNPSGFAHGEWATTALEYAIKESNWISATQLMSANCELTGAEILFINSTMNRRTKETAEEKPRRFRQFIGALLARAPEQATALHRSGLTVLQDAIQNENEDMILELFAFGVSPMPSDFLHMICNRTSKRTKVCRLSSSVQMKLVLDLRSSEPRITDVPTVRLTLAFACPGVVRKVLNDCPDFYDSEGLCYVIARVISKDKIVYLFSQPLDHWEKDQHIDSLTMDDFHAFVSRKTASKSHGGWESTAINMAARAGRADILRMLIGSSQEDLRTNGLIPLFILKEALTAPNCVPKDVAIDEQNSSRLGVWIKYCRMDDPNMRCSPLTAAAMVVPETAAQEIVDQLLELNYQPDSWTVLIASRQGHLSILQRLKRLERWQHILSHDDRPDWCPTALQTAVCSENVSTVRFLLNERAMIDAMDLSPCRSFCSALPLYLEDVYCILSRTALQHAVEARNMDLVLLLVNAGANVNAPAAMDSGATALQIASIQGSIPMVQYLISKSADPHAAGAAKHGRTALQGAAEHGRKDVVDLLLAHGASTAYQHREQVVKAVLYADKNGQRAIARILRESFLPYWSSEDEETLEMLEEDWESSSDHSVFFELRDEIEDWEETWNDWPEAWRADEGDPNCYVESEEPQIENYPAACQTDDSWFIHEMALGVESHGGGHVHCNGEFDLYDDGVVSGLSFHEETTSWVGFQQGVEGYDANDMVLGSFFES